MHDKHKENKMNTKSIVIMVSTLAASILNIHAACMTITSVVCHSPTSGTDPLYCCAWGTCGTPPGTVACCLAYGTASWTTTTGYKTTCTVPPTGRYSTLGSSINVECIWTESGTQCGLPFGPVQHSSPTTVYNCYNPNCSTTAN